MTRRIILVSPLSHDISQHLVAGGQPGLFYPPLGLLLVAQGLQRAGYAVSIYDGNYDGNYREALVRQAEQEAGELVFVGFYLSYLQMGDFLKLVPEIRRVAPRVPIVTGGPLTGIFAGQLLQAGAAEICCTGEGARVAVELAGRLVAGRSWHELPNLSFLADGRVTANPRDWQDELGGDNLLEYERFVDIDRYAPQFQLYLPPAPAGTRRAMPLLTGIGCSSRCAFCENAILGRRHRSLPAEAIVAQLEHYAARFRIDAFAFLDEDFFSDRPRLLRFVELLEQKRLPIRWGAEVRVNYFHDKYVNREMLARLAAVGCVRLAMGVESGSPAMLARLNKQITPDQVRRAAVIGADSPIRFTFSLMTNLPGETRGDLLATLALMDEVMQRKTNSQVSAVHPFVAYPGTPLAKLAEEQSGFSMNNVTLDDLARLDLVDYNQKIFKGRSDPPAARIIYFIRLLTKPEQHRYYRRLFAVLRHLARLRIRLNWFGWLVEYALARLLLRAGSLVRRWLIWPLRRAFGRMNQR